MSTPNIKPVDVLKYAAALLKSPRMEWAVDSIGGALCDGDHEAELDTVNGTIDEIRQLTELFGDPNRYSDGRVVTSSGEIQPGFVTTHVWFPDQTAEEPTSRRGNLPSFDPDVPAPGIYQVSTDPKTQMIHVSVIRAVEGGA